MFISKDELLSVLSYILDLKKPHKQSQAYYSTFYFFKLGDTIFLK